ncbi:hypothetical protein MPC4_60044 [Methylocella tundrae]|uniref:Uncharacterized protein n=1 Tax=Methylocella tundrae TaxID=227605 RepID=A0A8B6MBN5_METTU|nr:hypothetical protein MPC1_1220006 [Methylocella tundrae]VTZ51955.1 hypothetical protein MPC4_60044 [Methylocella tundrae]
MAACAANAKPFCAEWNAAGAVTRVSVETMNMLARTPIPAFPDDEKRMRLAQPAPNEVELKACTR